MTVKIFVSRDSEDRPWAPDYTHEARAAQDITMRLWAAFHHLPTLCAVIANLHEPSADMVLMTERGVGVIELKHNAGNIAINPDGTWYADHRPIQAGRFSNPHEQVQAYAQSIRDKTLQLILPPWLRRTPSDWDAFKFQTSVCFTNPDSRTDGVKKQVTQPRLVPRARWENDFSVTIPEDIPNWAANLRFQVDMGRQRRFEPYRLAPSSIVNVITLRFGATEWREILELMPTGKPYAFLALLDNEQQVQTFGLHKDLVVVGRDPSQCDVVIPKNFSRVSRVHARIVRRVDSIIIDDESMHGTFVNGQPVTGNQSLMHKHIITLGGSTAGEKVCGLQFLMGESTTPELGSTEVSGRTA